MNNLKHLLLDKLNGTSLLKYLINNYKYYRKYGVLKTIIYFLKGTFRRYCPSLKLSKGEQIKRLLSKCNININKEGFIYSIDSYKVLNNKKRILDNFTIDYSIILDNSLEDLINKEKLIDNIDYRNNVLNVLEGINVILDKEINKLSDSKRLDKDKYLGYLNNIKNGKCKFFEEALQRILFFNQLLWQTNHMLNGLGRLDLLLDKYYEKDKDNYTEDEIINIIKDFLLKLHDNYWYKSNSLLGDTGQIIILGGTLEDNTYFSNDLTYYFIRCIKDLQIPDPKILLRVNKDVPNDLMELSLSCIKTGVGCPLLANDEVIINNLIKFGYDKKDAYNYVISACWEPLILGDSLDQNNVDSIVYIKPFNKLLDEYDLDKIDNIEKLLSVYKTYLEDYLKDFLIKNSFKWEEDPLISLFITSCNKRGIDISNGGAKYNNYGFTSVSLPNLVNSILNIETLVFKEHKYTLKELNNARLNNFKDESILKDIKNVKERFGQDNDHIIDITNNIINTVGDYLNDKRNIFNGKYKFGLSAPSYISLSYNVLASLCGRHNYEPFDVHISINKYSNGYTELFSFASSLNYSNNSFNGNVIDFIVSKTFIEKNFDKFNLFLKLSIDKGFFETQMNVINSDILLRAKKNPQEFPNLIVRVWGFSAYFNDLPDEYKDVIIKRTLEYEGKLS